MSRLLRRSFHGRDSALLSPKKRFAAGSCRRLLASRDDHADTPEWKVSTRFCRLVVLNTTAEWRRRAITVYVVNPSISGFDARRSRDSISSDISRSATAPDHRRKTCTLMCVVTSTWHRPGRHQAPACAHPPRDFSDPPRLRLRDEGVEAFLRATSILSLQILSTEGMIGGRDLNARRVPRARGKPAPACRDNPPTFHAANAMRRAFMKVTTLPTVLISRRKEHRITCRNILHARCANKRMVSIGGQTPLSPVPESTVDPGE